jgi:MoaA/NifB/PqqE/SkfB family radical SAM enzyme
MLVEIAPARLASEALASHRITAMPVLVLDIHSRCNCRCLMCDIWKRDSAGELSIDTLNRHRESLRALKVRWAVLSGGEALMHSNFSGLCGFLRNEGIRITLLTAGISLAKRAQDVAYNVDDVIVSLDGPQAIHDRVRGVKGAYDLLALGIVRLLSLRPELQITARTTVQKANHQALCETVEAAKDLDLSGISFLAADVTSTAFNREKGWTAAQQDDVALSAPEIDSLTAELQALIARYPRELDSGYIAESPAKLRRIEQHFRAHLGQVVPRAPVCNAPWVSTVIAHDGTVRPCFFHAPIGNVNQQSLEEVVNGPAALAFRSSLDIATDPVCQRCVCSLHLPTGDQR